MSDKAAKDAFQELARQEQGHQNWLGQYLRGELKEGALSSGQAIDYKIAERFDQPTSEVVISEYYLNKKETEER